jgi:predicted solute-binding protein
MFDAVVAEAMHRTGLSLERITRYFRTDLNYKMTDRHHKALLQYEDLCRKHGFIAKRGSEFVEQK